MPDVFFMVELLKPGRNTPVGIIVSQKGASRKTDS
jgi:hypothetical protein